MPLTACFVRGCDVNERDNQKIYYFPSKPERKQKWLRFCGQQYAPRPYHGVCRRHFKEEDHLPSHRLLGTDEHKWRLMLTTVPSLHGPAVTDCPLDLEEPPEAVQEEVVNDHGEEEMILETEHTTDPLHLCRLCLTPLQDTDDKARHIFEAGGDIQRRVQECFQLLLDDAPDWPAVACGACVDSFEYISMFKRQIVSSHEYLHNKIVQSHSITAITVDGGGMPQKPPPSKAFLVSLPDYQPEVQQKMLLFAQRMQYMTCREADCGQVFETFQEMAQHSKIHPRGVHITCCSMQMNLGKRVLDHLKLHVHDKGSSCVVCKEEFDGNFEALYDHMYACHRDVAKIPLRCKECGKLKATKNKLRMHMLWHLPKEQKPHACPQCPERFASHGNLRRHIGRMHDVQVRVVCDICGKGFTDHGNMGEHRRKCSGERLRGVGNRKRLLEQIEQKKPEDMADPVSCPVCLMTVDRADMRVHSLKHVDSPINNLFCKICLVRVHGGGNFTAHMDRHLNRRYPCEVCPDVEYDNQTSFYCHMRTKHAAEFEQMKRRKAAEREAKQKWQPLVEGDL